VGLADLPGSASPLFDAVASRLRVTISPGAGAAITSFLLARIDEDEILVRRQWEHGVAPGPGTPFDLRRYLYEFTAKRMIVALHTPRTGAAPALPASGIRELLCAHDGTPYPCLTLQALALPYADHPDYRDEWRTQRRGPIP
jgi:hypothetical protein